MKKTWIRKLKLSILKKTPLLGLTVLQLCILFVVINGGLATILASQHQKQAAQDTSANLPSYTSDTKTAAPTTNAVTQGNSQSSPSSTQNSTKSATSTTNASLPDQYGCIPQTSGYDSCVKAAKQNALTLSCDSKAKTAGDTYYTAEAQAQAAYDAVMAEWNAVKDQPYYTHSPYDEYATDAKTKYNAIEKPAYATYSSTINSLNAQGCNEILVYSDTSWAGY